LGETEVALRQKSVTSGGGKGGRSVSRSEQRQKRPLLSANEFLQLDKGHCVFINPGHRSGRGTKASAYVPLHKRVKIPAQEVKAVERSEKLWPKIKEKRARQSPQREVTARDQALRRRSVERALPTRDEMQPQQEEDSQQEPQQAAF